MVVAENFTTKEGLKFVTCGKCGKKNYYSSHAPYRCLYCLEELI